MGLPAGLLLGWFIGWFGVPVKRPAAGHAARTASASPGLPAATPPVPSSEPTRPEGAAGPAAAEDQEWARPAGEAPQPSPPGAKTDGGEPMLGLEAAAGLSDLQTLSVSDPAGEPDESVPSPQPDEGADRPTDPAVIEPPTDQAILAILGERGARDVEEIEGIGRIYAGRLREAGITSIAALFAAASTDYRRRKLADELRISRKLILRWVNHADLVRVEGVDTQLAELLEAAGVDSPTELQHRVPANLAARMAEVDAEKHIAPEVPDEATVARWVEAAKTLPKIVSH